MFVTLGVLSYLFGKVHGGWSWKRLPLGEISLHQGDLG